MLGIGAYLVTKILTKLVKLRRGWACCLQDHVVRGDLSPQTEWEPRLGFNVPSLTFRLFIVTDHPGFILREGPYLSDFKIGIPGNASVGQVCGCPSPD